MGKVIPVGIKPKLTVPVPPVTDIALGDIAVGSIVNLMVDGVSTEFVVINHGVPSGSSLYDSSCDGIWLIAKGFCGKRVWDSSNNDYANSDIHAYLNGTFLGLFDADVQSAIKQVKIPYVKGTGSSGSVASGANGLSAKIFLLSATEIGHSFSYYHTEGAKVSANLTSTTSVDYNPSDTWALRSPRNDSTTTVAYVAAYGGPAAGEATASGNIHPALVLPSNALFDPDTLLFKGVA